MTALPDSSTSLFARELQQRLDGKTKPPGSLGQLERLALRLGLIQQSLQPTVSRPHLLVFAGDHGAARDGISAYPQEVTWQMVENFLAGGAAINVFCREFEIGLSVVDAGVAHDFGKRPGLVHAKIGAGTASYLREAAMTPEQVDAALARGRELTAALADHGCNTVGFGEMGIGNTASASLIRACLMPAEHGGDLERLTGRGTGHDDAGLARKLALLQQALARGGRPTDPRAVLAEYGGFEIAMMAGAMLEGASRGLTLVIDGFIVTSALLVARALEPAVLDACVFAHTSAERGHAAQLAWLGAEPLLSLGLRLGEGTGAALAMPLLRAACAMLNDMASFDSAGVSGRSA